MTIQEEVQSPDRVLLLKIANGDEKSFNKFYSIHKNNLFRQALRRSADNTSAEEIFVDFFSLFTTKLLRFKEDFVDDIFKYHQDSALPYMMIMIRNLIIDDQRSKSKKQQREQPLFLSIDEATENKAGFIEINDDISEENSQSAEIYNDALKLIWRDFYNLEEKLRGQYGLNELDRKRIEKELINKKKDSQLFQDIFDLLYIDGCTCTEVAKILEIDPKTFRVKRELLRDLLSTYFID